MRSVALILLLALTQGLLAAEDVVIQNARVFDGDRVMPRVSVLVRDEYGGDTGQGGRPSIDKATLQALIVAAHALAVNDWKVWSET